MSILKVIRDRRAGDLLIQWSRNRMRTIEEVPMKAILIDAHARSIEKVDIANKDDIEQFVGYDTLISDEIDDSGDRLFLDEECFIRGASGRFQIDKLAPVAGRAVITGVVGAGGVWGDVNSTTEDISRRVTWL
jgi:hypothetical protein